MLTFGVTAGIFSLIIGNIGKFEHRLQWIFSSFLVYYALLVTMLLWRPNLIDLHIFYVLVGIAGMTGAIWSSFIPGETDQDPKTSSLMHRFQLYMDISFHWILKQPFPI